MFREILWSKEPDGGQMTGKAVSLVLQKPIERRKRTESLRSERKGVGSRNITRIGDVFGRFVRAYNTGGSSQTRDIFGYAEVHG